MALNPADAKLREEQLRTLRRKWLKDQELSPREPVLPEKRNAVERFWANFLKKGSLWRRATFQTYNVGVQAVTKFLIPLWVIHYVVKYHLQATPNVCVTRRPLLFPGDIIAETNEVIPPIQGPSSDHHH